MGMYTELIFGASINLPNTPSKELNVLKYLFGEKIILDKDNVPNHKFFKCDRWTHITNSSSYYFGTRRVQPSIEWDGISKTWICNSRANLKNYADEIELFLDWIKPYIEQGTGTRDMYAIVCYEEQAEPTIYYLKDKE